MAGSRLRFALGRLLSDVPTAPVPIGATFSLSSQQVVTTFDQPLIAGSIDTANWDVQLNIGAGIRRWRPAGSVQAVGSRVQWIAMDVGSAFLASTITYAPPPFDVLGLAGAMPAAAFAFSPVVIVA